MNSYKAARLNFIRPLLLWVWDLYSFLSPDNFNYYWLRWQDPSYVAGTAPSCRLRSSGSLFLCPAGCKSPIFTHSSWLPRHSQKSQVAFLALIWSLTLREFWGQALPWRFKSNTGRNTLRRGGCLLQTWYRWWPQWGSRKLFHSHSTGKPHGLLTFTLFLLLCVFFFRLHGVSTLQMPNTPT